MKEIKLELVKDNSGITATNETVNTVDYFDESEEARKEFIKYLVEFMNTEVDDGAKYK